MEKLILSFLLVTSSLYAAGPEILQGSDSKNFVAQIQDLEVEDMLSKTKEFSECRNMNKFDANLSKEARDVKIKQAEECFKQKLGGKNLKNLETLSQQLNLQHYGLVQSKSVKDLQKYLNEKMYKSMTGVSLDEANRKQMAEDFKFGKRKHIDQAIFIQMYKTQLGKNAMYEISRFCFENFRLKSKKDARNFAEHWADFNGTIDLDDATDSGEPVFGTLSDPSDKAKVYEDIFKSLQTAQNQMPKNLLEQFFTTCGKAIVPMCDKFQTKLDLSKAVESKVDATGTVSLGANACLAKSRIQEFRRTLANVEKVADEFEKMQNSDKAITLMMAGMKGEPVKLFGDGKDSKEESVDELTNYSTKDIIEGGFKESSLGDNKSQECEERPELKSCEGYVFEGDSFDKAKHRVEMELTLKRAVEMERVKKIVEENDKDLKKYLEDNGHIDILNELESLSADQIVEKIGQSYEAKKLAMLEQLNLKLGKRQVSKKTGEESKLNPNDVKDIIKDSKEERARLAQVVLFNNIITSHLKLVKTDGTEAGRNVGAWKKEEKGLADAKIDPNLFSNLKTTGDDQGIGKDAQVAGFAVLDEILGKTPENPGQKEP